METETIRIFREKLRQLERQLGWVLKNDVQCCGISMAQCHALLEIGKKEEIAIVELAALLGLDTSTLSRTIDNMVKAGLVNRLSNPDDRRYVSLTLTRPGKQTYDFIEKANNAFIEMIFAGIPTEKHQQVIESFQILTDAIRQCNESNGCCNILTNNESSGCCNNSTNQTE
jgi:DNA-binding MarR family transcriptional regulator